MKVEIVPAQEQNVVDYKDMPVGSLGISLSSGYTVLRTETSAMRLETGQEFPFSCYGMWTSKGVRLLPKGTKVILTVD